LVFEKKEFIMDPILQLLFDNWPAVIIFIGGWIGVKCWIGNVIEGIGETYRVLKKAEADETINETEWADVGRAAGPFLIELRERARGLTFLKLKF